MRSVAAAVPPLKTPSCTVSSKKVCKLVPDSPFTIFTSYHLFEVCKLDDSVVDRYSGSKEKFNTRLTEDGGAANRQE